jgi:hypothetical protein
MGKALVLAIKRWVRSWANGTSCGTATQFELSKKLLLLTLGTNEEVHQALGPDATSSIRQWILQQVSWLEYNFAFYPKRRLRCFDEYVTNLTEGMNYAAKYSGMSTKPNQSMATAANAMNSHEDMKAKDRRNHLWRSSTAQPLYIQEETNQSDGHNIQQCISKLRPIAVRMLIDQYTQKDNYVLVQLAHDRFLAIRDEVKTPTFPGCPLSFKGPPQFREAHVIDIVLGRRDGDRILVCSCGYKQRFGICCRHILGLECRYELDDIASRWQTSYALYAFECGYDEITTAYQRIETDEHAGIRIKSMSLLLAGSIDKLPRLLTTPGDLTVQSALELYYSSVPICWNYEVNDYPPEFNPDILCTASAAALPQFSQEYTSTGFDNLPQVTLTAEIARIATRQGGASNASNASIIQQLKALLSLVTTQEDRNSLSKLLGSFENDMYKAKAAAMTKRQQASLFGSGTNADMQDMVDVSFGLPLDTDNKSTQNTYQSKRRKL